MRFYTILMINIAFALGISACSSSPHQEDEKSTNKHTTEFSPAPTNSVQNSNNKCDAVCLNKLAIQARKEGQTEKGQMLQKVAFQRMKTHISEIPAMWSFLQGTIESQPDDFMRSLKGLQVFLHEIDAVLSTCSDENAFDQVWSVREAVIKTVDTICIKAKEPLLIQLSKLNEICSGKDFGQSLLILQNAMSGQFGGNHDNYSLESLLAVTISKEYLVPDAGTTNPESPQNSLDEQDTQIFTQLENLINLLLDQEQFALDMYKNRIAVEVSADRKISQFEPDLNVEGKYQQILADLSVFGESVENANLATLLTYANSEVVNNRLNTMVSEIAALNPKVNDFQIVRYNLWAMQRIYTSETAPAWPGLLGSIEIRLLHPNVSTLYSMTYDALVRKETDSGVRRGFVHQMLNTDKFSLEQF